MVATRTLAAGSAVDPLAGRKPGPLGPDQGPSFEHILRVRIHSTSFAEQLLPFAGASCILKQGTSPTGGPPGMACESSRDAGRKQEEDAREGRSSGPSGPRVVTAVCILHCPQGLRTTQLEGWG